MKEKNYDNGWFAIALLNFFGIEYDGNAPAELSQNKGSQSALNDENDQEDGKSNQSDSESEQSDDGRSAISKVGDAGTGSALANFGGDDRDAPAADGFADMLKDAADTTRKDNGGRHLATAPKEEPGAEYNAGALIDSIAKRIGDEQTHAMWVESGGPKEQWLADNMELLIDQARHKQEKAGQKMAAGLAVKRSSASFQAAPTGSKTKKNDWEL